MLVLGKLDYMSSFTAKKLLVAILDYRLMGEVPLLGCSKGELELNTSV